MSITYGDNLKHNNPLFPIVDVEDVKGGIRTITTFDNTELYNAFNDIPEKLKQNYTNLIVTSTNQHYYLSGTDATVTTSWTLTGSGLSASGTTNSIPKWTSSTSLGDSIISDNGDTVTINGNLTIIGTSSTIVSENLLVKDPIILLAGSQSTPLYDAGLFVNRGTGDTQALIWDESSSEFSFFSTTSSSTTMGNVSIGTYSNVRTGSLSVGTGTASNSRFLVSSSGGTNSLVVNESGQVSIGGLINPSMSLKVYGNAEVTNFFYTNVTQVSGSVIFDGGGNSGMKSGLEFFSAATNSVIKFTNNTRSSNTGNITMTLDTTKQFVSIGNLSNLTSTLFVKGTTSSIMKVVGTGATWSNSNSIFEINNNGIITIGTTTGSASLHITGTSSSYDSSLLVENSSKTQLLKVLNGGQIILGDNNYDAVGPGSVQGVFIIGQGTSSYGPNTSNPNLLTFIVGSTDGTLVSGLQGASLNHGNVRSGIYFTNNASDIVFRAGYSDEYGVLTGQLQERMRVNISGTTIINGATAMSGSKLFIHGGTSSSTTGSNVMLDLYNSSNSGASTLLSELAFSAQGQPFAGDPYNTSHRYAIISGYAQGWNNVSTAGGIKISTRATTGSSLVTALVIDPNGSVYNQSKGISNTIYGYQALLTATASLNNTAFGYQALYSSTVNESVAFGYQSLRFNTTGIYNTGLGNYSLYNNTTGGKNIAVGLTTLYKNKTGSENIAIGHQSLYNNTIGNYNTAIGSSALLNSTSTVSSLNIVNGGSGYTASSTFSSIQLSYISGSTAVTYPIITIYVGSGGTVSTATLETYGTGFSDTTTIMGANLGTGVTFSVSISALSSATNNTAIGYQSMYYNTTGSRNIGIGNNVLLSNTIGYENVAIGYQSMTNNITGSNNIGIGYSALVNNKDGILNIAIGNLTLASATQSYYNTAIGYQSLRFNTTGSQNVAVGYRTLNKNTTGNYNTTLGMDALVENVTGNGNTSIGSSALRFNTTGSSNIVIGSSAGMYDINVNGLTNSNTSIFIGTDTRANSDNQTNQIVIGHGATGSGSNSVTLGASTITKTQLRGTINIGNVPQYASNGAAISGGLVPGDIYQTLSNVLMVVV